MISRAASMGTAKLRFCAFFSGGQGADTDYFPATIHERSAGITRIECGIRLHEWRQPTHRGQRQRYLRAGKDAFGRCYPQAEGISDRKEFITYRNLARAPERCPL
jgi:hypothetical protein